MGKSQVISFVRGTFGSYARDESWTDYDCVVANSFGTSTDPSSVNAKLHSIANAFSLVHGRHIPLIMDETLVAAGAALPFPAKVDYVVRGPVSNFMGSGVGTFGVLEVGRDYMAAHGLLRPLLIGQAYHINRIAIQARSRKLGMNPVLMGYMPREFDRLSRQIWTRAAPLWVAHELIGAVKLKIDGKL